MDMTVRIGTELSPVQERNGLLYKREDLFRLSCGVNGAKLRACRYLISGAAARGLVRVVSAASVLSPQNAMAAVLAAEQGMSCTVILGGTRPETAVRHAAVRMAVDAGADFRYVRVGYNPALQRAARDEHARDVGSYWLRYGITTSPDADREELLAFHGVNAEQAANLPDSVRTLVIPFGSGNTAVGVLLGLARQRPRDLEKIVLVGIGPDRRDWLADRFLAMGVPLPAYEHLDLHGTGYASYGDRMPETLDGIVMHATYEGKVVRYLNRMQPDWWAHRDGTTCLWIVGGPLK